MYDKFRENSNKSSNPAIFSAVQNLKNHLYQKYGKIIDMLALFEGKKEHIHSIPFDIFSAKLGTLESIVKYLKEIEGLKFAKIAELTNRGQTSVRTSYVKSVSKDSSPLRTKSSDSIPLSVISNRKLTAFESICVYLHEKKGIRHSEISKILMRDQRVVWRTYNKAISKLSSKEFFEQLNYEIEKGDLLVSKLDIVRIAHLKEKTQNFFAQYINATITEPTLPLSVLAEGASPLRTVIKYLKDENGLSFSEISKLLNRALPLISSSYEKEKILIISNFDFSIPVRLLSDRKYSVMETVVHYMSSILGLRTKEIAAALNRSSGVISKHLSRYKEKNE